MAGHQIGYERGYAVLRIDHELRDRGHVQVLKIVLDEDSAQAEVDRLTAISESKSTTYEWQLAGIAPLGASWAPPDSAAGELLNSPEPPWVVVSPGLDAETLIPRVPPGVTYRLLRGRKMTTRQGVFNETAAAFQFPTDFGETWDSFELFVKDLAWLPAPAYLLAVADADQLLVSEASSQLATYLDTLHEVADWWSRRQQPRDARVGVAFHSVLACPPGRYEVLRNRLSGIGRDLPVLTDASWREF